MTPKKITPSLKSADSEYERFLNSVRPVGIGLAESVSRLDRGQYAHLMRQKGRPRRIISTEYKLTDADAGYFDASGKLSLAVTDSTKAAPALLIECTYETHFHCKPPASKELAERFTASELRLVLWPFFREVVLDLCGKMGIPPITIPLATGADE